MCHHISSGALGCIIEADGQEKEWEPFTAEPLRRTGVWKSSLLDWRAGALAETFIGSDSPVGILATEKAQARFGGKLVEVALVAAVKVAAVADI